MNIESQEATIKRIRSEVLRRKGTSQTPPPLPAPQKKSVLQKAASWLERAQEKHSRALKWPKFFRPLRRNQESINEALIASMQGMMREMEYFSRLSGPMGAQLSSLTARLDRETDEVQALAAKVEKTEASLASNSAGESLERFYAAFENQFRGDSAQIRERLANYLPQLQSLRERIPHGRAVDLRCGRGEWLGLLKENGIEAQGVDDNAPMVELCGKAGFNAVAADALEFLRGLAAGSLALVSGFHIVENVEFPYLLALMTEISRVLAPGGLAIIETPNPECPPVSLYAFYLNPKHRNPVPMELLMFVASHVGFCSTEVMRLQPSGGGVKSHGCEDYAGIFIK